MATTPTRTHCLAVPRYHGRSVRARTVRRTRNSRPGSFRGSSDSLESATFKCDRWVESGEYSAPVVSSSDGTAIHGANEVSAGGPVVGLELPKLAARVQFPAGAFLEDIGIR